MTSYSTYGTDRLRLVDGTLSPDDDERFEDERGTVVNCVAAGAMRALLDSASDLAEPHPAAGAGAVVVRADEARAVQWHSAAEGWELDALTDADQPAFLELVGRFVSDNLDTILALATRIAWDPRFAAEKVTHRNQGMSIYRIGELLGYQLSGQGIGFVDYSLHEHQGADLIGRLDSWLKANASQVWESTWIDSTEEPCLLHIDG